ncbi:MAG: hybrid sensor histidine kinase/response regulator [bacterium]|nr:MAG: hybrid sensor histidine kinase/response regulator [bacterium]
MYTKKEKLIYVIDDDPVMRMSCQQILVKEGYRIETFEDGLKGLKRIQEEKPELIIVDLKMPKLGGMEVIATVHEMDPDIVIVVITGYATIDTAVDSMKAGAYDFLPKPFTSEELRLIVNRGLERRHLIEESNRLRQEKEKMQRQFITFVSHQLQSPLVAIQQFLEVLNHLGDSPKKQELQQEWIERSIIKVKELIDLIRDWLQLSKIESGVLVDKIKAIDPFPIIADIVQTYNEQAKQNNITLTIDSPESVSTVKGDEECLNVLFSNLIINAIKYNKPNGKVTISIEEDSSHVNISVSDTGIGIPEEKLETIFEEFRRIKSESTKNISGTGLGLPICKKIMAELGGKIKVQSKLNEGSTFRISLLKYEE